MPCVGGFELRGDDGLRDFLACLGGFVVLGEVQPIHVATERGFERHMQRQLVVASSKGPQWDECELPVLIKLDLADSNAVGALGGNYGVGAAARFVDFSTRPG